MRTSPNPRLADETSPYVLQHADNPVDWFPWGNEAFEAARAADRPVFLSVGYAACHWCHVMAHESFEDPETARMLNEHFVSIKVDREERPDVDALYMDAVQAMTGAGGWPMSVFLTPGGEPFYAGTYFPDTPRHGMPSFRQVLDGLTAAWKERRDDVVQQGGAVADAIRRSAEWASTESPPEPDLSTYAARSIEGLRSSFDAEYGGFGAAPKFPHATTLAHLADRAASDATALTMLRTTLDRMAAGGIHDQVGGGFARYSTDRAWHVPHFEKMLNDNAQLLSVYARAFAITNEPTYQAVALGIGTWMLDVMQRPEGGFAASQDADSAGGEGTFATWTWDELVAAVGEDVAIAFGASPTGNWDGTNVLWFPVPLTKVAAARDLPRDELVRAVDAARRTLRDRRAQRPAPAIDDKVLAGWNGLAIDALATAGLVFGMGSFTAAAREAAEMLWVELRDDEERLLHSWRNHPSRVRAFADDLALVGNGYLELASALGEVRWIDRARTLADALLRLHREPRGGFFQVPDDADPLLARKVDLEDGPSPSGTSAGALLLARLARVDDDERSAEAARAAVARAVPLLQRAPLAAGTAAIAAEYLSDAAVDVAIVGDRRDPRVGELVRTALGSGPPGSMIVVADPSDPSPEPLALFQGRLTVSEPTAFVCRRYVCRRPSTDASSLRQELSMLREADD